VCSFQVSSKAILEESGVAVMPGSVIDSESRLGSYTYIGRNCYITKSEIGRYCSIANNVSIGQGEHALNCVSTSAFFYGSPWEILTASSCIVGNDVWIGVDAVILRGVMVGDGAVIAANSVVTRDVPPYAIVAGVPARLIRYRLNEEQMRAVQDSKWWEMEVNEAREVMKTLEQNLDLK